MASHNIPDDETLKRRVRSKTRYSDTPDELPAVELTDHIADVKLDFEEMGVTDFYADAGIQKAMLYATCIESKVSVENYSIDSWDLTGGSIDVSGAGDSEKVQFSHWAEKVGSGLSSSVQVTVTQSPTPSFSNTYN